MSETVKLIRKLQKVLSSNGESYLIIHCKKAKTKDRKEESLIGSVICRSEDFDILAEALFSAASSNGTESPNVMQLLHAMNRYGATVDRKSQSQ